MEAKLISRTHFNEYNTSIVAYNTDIPDNTRENFRYPHKNTVCVPCFQSIGFFRRFFFHKHIVRALNQLYQ